jgi:hypothetical protein
VKRSNAARAALALGSIALVVVLFVVLSGDGDEESPSVPATQAEAPREAGATAGDGESGNGRARERRANPSVTIVVKNGKPVGGVKRLEYKKGQRVRFAVESDVSDEVHVHGYDRTSFVNAGGRVRFNFKANLEGVFEIELESRHVQIAELRVKPS